MQDYEAIETQELGQVSSDTQGDNGRPIEGAGLLPVTGISD
ncbi:hypothetical protein [Sphingopyxis sp. MWB1]|nr:hypothetical protein [Sphingopyxis sp. MWB1]